MLSLQNRMNRAGNKYGRKNISDKAVNAVIRRIYRGDKTAVGFPLDYKYGNVSPAA